MESVSIYPADISDLSRLSDIHCAVLPNSLNAILGKQHVMRLYQHTIESPLSVVLVALDGGTVVGGASATIDARATRRAMIDSTPASQWLRIAWRVLTRPSCWHDVIFGKELDGPVLTTIVVDSAHQHCGIGRKLVNAVDCFFRSRSYFEYRVETRLDNLGAQEFYWRTGFCFAEIQGKNAVFARRLT